MKTNQVQIPRPKLDPNERYLRYNLMGDNVWPTLKDPRPDFRWKTLLFGFRTYLGSYFGVVSFRLKSLDEVMTSTMRILYSNRRWKMGWSEVKKNNTQSKVKSFNLSKFDVLFRVTNPMVFAVFALRCHGTHGAVPSVYSSDHEA